MFSNTCCIFPFRRQQLLTRSRLKLPLVVPPRKFLLLLPCGDFHLMPFPEVSVRAVMVFSATSVLMTSQLETNSGRSLAAIPFTLAASTSGCKRRADAVRRVGETSRIAARLLEVKTSEVFVMEVNQSKGFAVRYVDLDKVL